VGPFRAGVRLGVPLPGQRLFFGDKSSAAAYEAALARFTRLGAVIVEIDIEPFYETARLLYEGPWVAERYITAHKLIASSPQSMHPVTRQIILAGAHPSAVDAFAAFYELEELRRVRDHTFLAIDALVLPTVPTVYTIEQVHADPIGLNSRLGTYTNFVNLLDLCALAVPAAMHADGTPFGITLLAQAGQDAALAALGRVFHADTKLPLGATGQPQPPAPSLPSPAERVEDARKRADAGGGKGGGPAKHEIAVAVVGAHLSGMPLNGELRSFGARLVAETTTAPDYRLFALAGTTPPKPGLLRVATGGGAAIAVEIWAIPSHRFGDFIDKVAPPLSIGTLTTADGRQVKGFLVEAEATHGARDISAFGGWRAFMAQAKVSA
jgi:allophanate hydrolase